jgi:signal transduction histidine kinase
VAGQTPLAPLGRPPRLVLRFALYSGAVLLAAGLAILWTVNHEVAARAQRTVETQARLFAEQNLRRQLLTSDFTKPVRGTRRAALDDLFRRRILIPGIVGTRLFNRSGTITYAARHQLIGTRVPYLADVGGVFAGVPKRRVTRTVSWRGQKNVKVLQSLIPVRQAGSMKPIGALEIDLEEMDLAQIVEESIEACRPMAESRKIELVASVGNPPPLVGDRARLAQVLDNLVSNALKFTETGGRVEVTLSSDDGHVLLEVKDTGLGIDSEEQPLLFERFFRSSRATENAIPGTGLGLAITKAIVERHGGWITLESEEDVGTTVRVEIPTKAPKEADFAGRELPEVPAVT